MPEKEEKQAEVENKTPDGNVKSKIKIFEKIDSLDKKEPPKNPSKKRCRSRSRPSSPKLGPGCSALASAKRPRPFPEPTELW